MSEDRGPLGTRLRVGTVVSCRVNEDARKPAYVLEIDLGPEGHRTSSAQLTERYDIDDLLGRRVVVATDLGTRRIAGILSEVLVLGVTANSGETILLAVDGDAPNGSLVH